MRTSLIETEKIDLYLLNQSTTEDRLLFDAMLILDLDLKDRVLWQGKTHAMVNQYSRKQLKAEIAAVQQHLFCEPTHTSFREKVMSFFKAG